MQIENFINAYISKLVAPGTLVAEHDSADSDAGRKFGTTTIIGAAATPAIG